MVATKCALTQPGCRPLPQRYAGSRYSPSSDRNRSQISPSVQRFFTASKIGGITFCLSSRSAALTAARQRSTVAVSRCVRNALLRSICDELLAIDSKDFWEVIDRGTNFDYVDDARKAQLKVFFSWFPSLKDKEMAHA